MLQTGILGKVTAPEGKIFVRLARDPNFAPGEVAEWSIAAVLKTVVRETVPRVRIPPFPQDFIMAPAAIAAGFLFRNRRSSSLDPDVEKQKTKTAFGRLKVP